MDIFDPTGDGINAYTLAQTVKAAEDVLAAFDRLEESLMGCMTPLDLDHIWEEMEAAQRIVARRAEELKKVRNIIEFDRPVILVPMGSETRRYSAAENSTLRPEQIIQIRALVKKWPDHATRTYRTLCGPDAIPELMRYFRAGALETEPALEQRSSEEIAAKKAAANAKRAATRAANRSASEAQAAGGPAHQ